MKIVYNFNTLDLGVDVCELRGSIYLTHPMYMRMGVKDNKVIDTVFESIFCIFLFGICTQDITLGSAKRLKFSKTVLALINSILS